MHPNLSALIRFGTLVSIASAAQAQLMVTGTSPALNASNVAPNATITVDFDRAVNAASLAEFRLYGVNGGTPAGTTTLENGGTRIAFRPARPYFAGEVMTLNLSHSLQAVDGSFLRSAGYVTTFRVAAAPASMTFTQIQSFYTEPGGFTRIYGGQMCDLDGDDYLDMCAVSEVSSDVRVFKNTADGTGLFNTTPHSVNSVATEPSPNENADMNGDGRIDVVTCNVNAGSVSVLLGNGDGTFQPALSYTMGSDPHGLAVLDCDGDGDIDVFTANYGANNIAMRRNNGNGTLGAVSFFDGGGNGEWAITAADMDNDAIQDLVVGNKNSQTVVVMRCNGNATFTAQPSQSAGGSVWMIVCGDVNVDGKIDASCANSFSNNGSILYGNGNGTLQAPVSPGAFGPMIATDLADLDGDGDLDWSLSSFGGSAWFIFRNNGGAMTHVHTFTTGANPACSSLCDIDNDRDIDIILWTETSDEIRVVENDSLDTNTFCYGTNAACPCGNGGYFRHGCEHSFGSGGALLNAQGRARVSSDSIVLNCAGLPPAVSTLFFQGDAQVNGGNGSLFGDGLRCAGGAVLRLGTKVCSNGWTNYGGGGDIPVSIKGAVPAAGGTRYYQAWYRNAAAFCTANAYNLSNGLRLTWAP